MKRKLYKLYERIAVSLIAALFIAFLLPLNIPVRGINEFITYETDEADGAAINSERFLSSNLSSGSDIIVVLDPGHDSVHVGASGNGLREENLTLKIAQYCKAALEKGGIKVYMTHSDGSCLNRESNSACMQARVNYAKSVGANLLVSIHVDSSQASSANGATVIAATKDVYRNDLSDVTHGVGKLILEELVKLGLRSRGVYTRLCDDDGDTDPEYIYANGAIADWYAIVRKSIKAGFPGIIVEHGFISNASDVSSFLNSDAKLKALGEADAAAILKYFNADYNYTKPSPSLVFSSIPSSPATYNPGNRIELTAKLSGCAGQHNANKTVIFTLNGKDAGTGVTNQNGEAKHTIINPNAGEYVFGVRFDGDTDNNPATAQSATFKVNKATPTVSGTKIVSSAAANAEIGDKISLSVSGSGGETFTGYWSCKAPGVSGEKVTATFTVTGGTALPDNYNLPVIAEITVEQVLVERSEDSQDNGDNEDTGDIPENGGADEDIPKFEPQIVTVPAMLLVDLIETDEVYRVEIDAPYGEYLIDVDVPLFVSAFARTIAGNGLNDILDKVLNQSADEYKNENISGGDLLPDENAELQSENAVDDASVTVSAENNNALTVFKDNLNALGGNNLSLKITIDDISSGDNRKLAFDRDFPDSKIRTALIEFKAEIVNGATGMATGEENCVAQAVTLTMNMPADETGKIPEYWGAFKYFNETERFEFVPHTPEIINGKSYVRIKSAANGVYIVAENDILFGDVESNAWYAEVVRKAAAKGLVRGTGDGLYHPDRPVTRAEFVQIVVNAVQLSEPDNYSATANYSDVGVDSWYYATVMRAKSAGLLEQFPENIFKPDEALTREEAAGILASALRRGNIVAGDYMDYVDLSGVFDDYGEFGEKFRADASMMYALKIMEGMGDGIFSPKGTTLRTQAAALQMRFLKIYGMID